MLDPVAYPNLLQEGCVKTSDKDPGYNCIAHAAGDDEKWWWPKSGKLGYWPKGVTNKVTLGAFVQAFAALVTRSVMIRSLKAVMKKLQSTGHGENLLMPLDNFLMADGHIK